MHGKSTRLFFEQHVSLKIGCLLKLTFPLESYLHVEHDKSYMHAYYGIVHIICMYKQQVHVTITCTCCFVNDVNTPACSKCIMQNSRCLVWSNNNYYTGVAEQVYQNIFPAAAGKIFW